MKKLWQNKRKAEGKPYDKPNMVMNSAVQVCWEVSDSSPQLRVLFTRERLRAFVSRTPRY
jgi:hypothetical protein